MLPDVQGQRHGVRRRGAADRVRARQQRGHALPRRTACARRCASTTTASTSTAPTISSPQAATASIYFTDPDYGRWNDWIGCKREPLLGFTAVFRVPHEGGEAELVVEPGEFEQPNGLCFSPDESLMYVNDSPRAEIKVFEVADDGKLVNGRVLMTEMGRRHDRRRVPSTAWSATSSATCGSPGPGGVWVLDPDSGERSGMIETPEMCGSLCWGGPDLRTLFLTTSTTVHTMPTLCTSAPLPHYDVRRQATVMTDTDHASASSRTVSRSGRSSSTTPSTSTPATTPATPACSPSDGVLLAQLGEAVGPAAIEEVLDESLGPHVRSDLPSAIHVMNNHRIDIDGDTATTDGGLVLPHRRSRQRADGPAGRSLRRRPRPRERPVEDHAPRHLAHLGPLADDAGARHAARSARRAACSGWRTRTRSGACS